MSEPKKILLAIDFDGVVCRHAKFPNIGESVPGAIEWLKRFKELGAKQFLWTCRNNDSLQLAITYIRSNGLELEGYNSIDYGSKAFAPFPKLFANIYIDDAAFGAPLVKPNKGRSYLDWEIVGPEVEKRIIKNKRYL